MIDVTVLGGVREYGRNCFLVTDQATNTRIMLDCGVRNGNPEVYPVITEEIAQSIQAVFISHIHNDHIGALPLLAEKGFQGDVWMSETSLQQLQNIIPKWQGTSLNALRFRSFDKRTRGKLITISDNLSFIWGYSGHMLGSVWYSFYLNKQSIFFSGDITLASPLLVTDTPAILSYDVALIDSGHAAQTMPYENSIHNILSILKDPSESYQIPITISGKACDLLFLLYHALPDRNFVIDHGLMEHLHCYLKNPDNIHKEKINELAALMQSERVTIYEGKKETGIYLLLDKVAGFPEIKTGVYQDEKSPFYKSHPDNRDLKTLVRTIDAEEYIFFHSERNDLKTILDGLRTENYILDNLVQ
ncbi:MBL fold metallo-hydrolase [Gracilibacillus saliphilus]|uniref:MBL fold metallo-hydrolase n=1 Tax=Gracilibacillus saliphilus TaxID=543890 RepID=UPI0013D6DECA|nr:MBL fold metallo-hydrolase [Gracilibacillus saliphilus]